MNYSELIEAFCEDRGYTFTNSYCGRDMYGRRCIGISCEYGLLALVELCEYLAKEGVSDLAYVLGMPFMDETGTGFILYFPELRKE